MLDTLKLYNELKENLEPEAALKIAEIIGNVYSELSDTVTKAEFNELREVVQELAEAQKRTEQRVEELAEAQKRTEQRVEELAEAQKRTEQRLDELAEAQKRTEQRLDSLTQRVEELAEAQKRTEKELHQLSKIVRKLITDHQETRRQLGGLAMTVGYRLEDEAFGTLPKILKKDHGIILKEKLKRKFVQDKFGKYIEVNIIGKGVQNSTELLVVGEAKSQLSTNDIDNFIRKKIGRLKGVQENIFPLLVTYMITAPEVEEYANSKGVALYYSYELR